MKYPESCPVHYTYCSILVHIYGSQEMFVSEYRTLLADRLLQSLNYDISREVCVTCS